jgi:hypothetical protein|tara:strand:- start:1066 stop:1224 length:159 start_codon:yes stop_codon:yes gene_type:complete
MNIHSLTSTMASARERGLEYGVSPLCFISANICMALLHYTKEKMLNFVENME